MKHDTSRRLKKFIASSTVFFFFLTQIIPGAELCAAPVAPGTGQAAQQLVPEKNLDTQSGTQTVTNTQTQTQQKMVPPSTMFLADDTALSQPVSTETKTDSATSSVTATATASVTVTATHTSTSSATGSGSGTATATGTAVGTGTNYRAPEAAAAQRATSFLIQALSLNAAQQKDMQVVSVKPQTWNNGGVGWNTPNDIVTMNMVSDYVVVISLYGNTYEFHAGRLDPLKMAAITVLKDLVKQGAALNTLKIHQSSYSADYKQITVQVSSGNVKWVYGIKAKTYEILSMTKEEGPNQINVEVSRAVLSAYTRGVLNAGWLAERKRATTLPRPPQI